MFSVRAPVSRPAAVRAPARRSVVTYAEPLNAKIEEAIKTAEEVCEDGQKDECATAWDEVEELSAAASHKKDAGPEDPLEKYCEEVPEADECRVYED